MNKKQRLWKTIASIACAIVSIAWRLQVGGCQDALGPGEEMLYQCDFDENIGGGFTVDPYAQGAKLTNEERNSGVYSLCCHGNQEYYQYFGRISQLPIKPGRTYRLRVWSKISDKPLVLIYMFFLKNGRMTIPPLSASLKVPPSKEWRQNDLTFTVPPDYEGGELRFRFCTASPKVIGYFDDLSLVLLPPGLKADYQCNSKQQVVNVEVNVADFLDHESLSRLGIVIEFVSKKTGAVASRHETRGLKKMVSEITCPIRDLDAGDYEIVVKALASEGKTLDTCRLDFAVFREPEWVGNRLGILPPDAEAPQPWSNLNVRDASIECWGRQYVLGKNGLPERIVVLGKEILARPVKMDIEIDEKPAMIRSLRPEKCTKLLAVFKGESQVNDVTVTVSTEVEFDGMLKHTLRIVPGKEGGSRLNRLTLQIPFARDAARLLQRVLTEVAWKGGLTADLTRLDEWQLAEFCPHIWVGTEERGLAWFAESDKLWRNEAGPRFQIIKTEKAVILQINIISSPVTLDAPREYVFGLQATPTRPMWPGWKAIRFRTKTLKSNVGVIWSNAKYDKYHGFPMAADDPTAFENLLAGIDYPLRLIYLRHCYEGVPEFKYYEDRWRTTGTVYGLEAAGFSKRLFPVDHTDPIWQDFIVQRIHDWIQRWNITGMYHDCFGPCVKDGAFQIFAFRELAKRVYVLHRQLYPRALTIVFGQPYAPLVSFSDAILSGEMYRHPLAKHGYYPAFMDLATFRAENVINLGPARMILPQYKVAYRDSVPHAVHAMGIFLLHDLTVYASWFNMDVYDDIETRRLLFGRADSAFFPYWKPGGRAKSADPGLKVSYYEKPDALLLIVANITGKDITATLYLDTTGLKLAPAPRAQVYDPLTRQQAEMKLPPDGVIHLSVKRYSMVLAEVR